MSVRIEMYKVAGRTFLDHFFEKSFDQFIDCCGECWSCYQRNTILNEFEKKGFKTFNSAVDCWKFIDELNRFEIILPVEAED